MDSNIGKNIDRISNLPDALLCHILSFLPTKYAVGSSTLSTRWQYLWTSVPNLDFDDSKCFQEYARLSEDKRKEVDLSFQYFVNRVLLLSDAPCFQQFHLQIGGSLQLLDLVDTWISAAVKRNVQDLNLINGLEINVRLPVRLFTSKTLVVLSLSGVLLHIPCSVWLPSLKNLRLDYVEYGDEDSLQEFLIGCPILEEMYIHRWTVDSQMVLNVSVPTLKRLTVFCYRDDFIDQLDDSDEPDDQGCKLVVDAPQLEYLYLADFVDILLRNLPSLSKASFSVRHVCLRRRSFIDGLRMYKLLSGITNVKVLEAHLAYFRKIGSFEDEKQFVVFFDFREDVKHLVEIVNLAEYSRWWLP